MINDIQQTPKNGKQLQITQKKPIPLTVADQMEHKTKSNQILNEIHKIMKVKRLLAEQE